MAQQIRAQTAQTFFSEIALIEFCKILLNTCVSCNSSQFIKTSFYSGANVDVRPYGIVKHHFVAEFDNELGLNEGDMVYLIRYVDNEWLEAELDASRRYEIIFIITLICTN